MNRAHFYISVIFAGQLIGCSASSNIAEIGHPLVNRDLVVEWVVPTNAIPTEIDIFKVKPSEFDAELLKKMVALCGFSNQDLVLARLKPSLEGRNMSFQDTQDGKFLSISPAWGRIYFHNPHAISGTQDAIDGVPSDAEVLAKTLATLQKLGVNETQLRRKTDSNELFLLHDIRSRGRKNKETGKLEKQIIARGVWLSRAEGGVGIAGRGCSGGIIANYGNRGEIAELEFVWRKFTNPEKRRCADPKEIVRRIVAGKAFVETDLNPAAIKSLKIIDATVYYFGEDSLREQREMYPFVSLKAQADAGNKSVEVFVNCPLLLN